MQEIILKKGKEFPLKRFHPWVFSGALKTQTKGIEEGEKVRILDSKGNFLGIAHFQDGSIALRVISWEDRPIDVSFWKEKIEKALAVRNTFFIPNAEHTNCFRLIHAEGDGLPGLIVDVYKKTAVIQAHSIGMHKDINLISEALQLVFGSDLSSVYSKSQATLPERYGVGIADEHLLGTPTSDIVLENGYKFMVNWQTGQKTGFFLDQRVNRALLGAYSAGKTVLNTFAYSGGFSIYALGGGAEKVVSVDISKTAVDLIDENVKISFGEEERHTSLKADVMKYLGEEEEEFDIVIVDPPAFAKNVRKRHNAVMGYKRLNMMAIDRVKKGGLLFTYSCSQVVDDKLFYDTIVSASIEAGRPARVLHKLSQGPDHPVSIYHKEGHYLKGLVLRMD
ncbi:MAG: class I SAM-dependent rRNA methyltransferase [Saprospiraceae bacterium]|nr:class I SAM-dependent rRNA methyltransferase [Saprospiraceae bacterium]